MSAIPEDCLYLFDSKTIAHVGTIEPDGSPHVTPVWIDYDPETERLLVNTERGRRKEQNVARDPRVSVSMVDPDDPYRRLAIAGEVVAAREEGARDHIDELSRRYIKHEYENRIETRRVVLEIRVDRVLDS